MLEKELKYFEDNIDMLLNLYRGKHIVIKNNEVIASYNDPQTAFTETLKHHELGTFMIHECLSDEEYQQKYFNYDIVFA